ncbi:hypothetical protein CEXT_340341 [Caerostris extrusa]|uniref:Uncharacterized protein n=1 Tax=Caerostris extrusa TaxID=172846 RepID=A0AAV4SKZ0_CAEEX|nr:hypothetical protein CEXT_340341 [Caerostris extrusa]
MIAPGYILITETSMLLQLLILSIATDDKLLHKAKYTPYMSTLVLQSSYQIGVYPPDQDKYAPESYTEEAQLVTPPQEKESILKLHHRYPTAGDTHDRWSEKLSSIPFALNLSKSDTTGHIATYLQFGRELQTIDDIDHYLK